MFEDPFRLGSIAGLQTPPKELPKRPKSPPKSCREWLASQEQQLPRHGARPEEGGASPSWPKRAPEGERLFEASAVDSGILGSLENIKADIQRHAR